MQTRAATGSISRWSPIPPPQTTTRRRRGIPSTWNIDDTPNWLKGAHSFSFGGSFLQLTHNQRGWNLVPTLTIAVDQTNDPANAMFNSANFPGASTAALTEARNIYALLTGRVTAVTGNARLDAATGEYVYLGNLFERSRINSFATFAQDSWRISPAVTVNYGLRWDIQRPFTPLSNAWSTATMTDLCGASGVGSGPGGRACNMFQPGNVAGGARFVPSYTAFTPGTSGYETDWNNFAPNAGIAWRPNVQSGFLRRLLGDPDQATVRAGYAVSYSLERLDRFSSLYGDNPGGEIAATRNHTTGFPMIGPGETAPVLLRDRARLGPPAFPASPVYPIAALPSNELNVFDPNLDTPYVQSFSVGLQRSLGRDTALEVRYVGNRNRGRRFGAGTNGLVNALLGDWDFSGIARFQMRQYSTHEGRLVGMTLDELQDAFEIRKERSSAGTITVWSFPQDIVDNTRRAFNTDPTSATGYGAEGPPTGRYIAPLSSPECLSVYVGDCAPRQIKLLAPLFSRVDLRIKKRFQFATKAMSSSTWRCRTSSTRRTSITRSI